MAGLAGISGIQGFIQAQPEASAEERQGGPADPSHARAYWAVPERMPWELQAWSPTPASPVIDSGLPEEIDLYCLPAGTGTDATPYYGATPVRGHAAPWPKGVETSTGPDATARQLEQSAVLHADGMGESKHWFSISALNDTWHEDWNPGAESATLQDPVNGQVRGAAGGFGSTDRVGNPRGINDQGDMQNAHLHRRYATGSVPGNYMWMKPGGRPMIKTTPGPARPPIGQNSPFTGQDLTAAFGTQGAVLTVSAPDYEAPPEPYTAPPLSQQYPSASGCPSVDWW
jgi:hypothetical protein